MLILAFGHKARNGKDTAGEAVQNFYDSRRKLAVQHGLTIKALRVGIFKFAAALYEEARVLHGMKGKDAALLQRIGSDRRAEDIDYWVKKCFADIDRCQPDIAIITDLRYQNEAAAIKARGGVTVDVVRLNPDGTRHITDDRPADHISEVDLDGYNFDHYIWAKTGEVALVSEMAITLSEYLLKMGSN